MKREAYFCRRTVSADARLDECISELRAFLNATKNKRTRRALDHAIFYAERERYRNSKRVGKKKSSADAKLRSARKEQEKQDASKSVASNNGQPWTGRQDQLVMHSSLTDYEIAVAIGRTACAVRLRRQNLRKAAKRAAEGSR